VLPGQQLLLLMTESFGRATGLEVHQRTIVYGDDDEGARAELSETLTYRVSNALRIETAAEDLMRIRVDTLDAMLTIVDGHVAPQDESRFDRYPDLLLFHSRALLQERLSRRGIDTMVTSLGRFEGEPVYILGAQYPDMTTAQIWIDKETFWPLRLLIPLSDGEGTSMLEFRYLLWQQDRKLWYPMRIECYENDRLIRETVVDEMLVNPSIPDGDFDIEQMAWQYGDGSVQEEALPASDPRDDIQKALDDFKKRYE